MLKQREEKATALQERGVLNARADGVRDSLFATVGFFDARDLVQVKYEMVRRVQEEGWTVARAVREFGLSRTTFYQARAALAREGLPGLLPQRPGPRDGHKLNEVVLGFVEEVLSQEGAVGAAALAQRVRERFGTCVHPRSIERALARRRAGKGGKTPRRAAAIRVRDGR